VSRWQRYWFSDGGRTALAIVRIAIAAAVLLTLARLDNPVSTGDLPGSRTLYRPVGIWMLLGEAPPADMLVKALWVAAWAGTLAMLLGLVTRTATAVSCIATIALAALSFSSSRSWSHQYNVVLLAQIAMLGARAGDVLSIDWLIRRLRGLPSINVPRGYQWSLRLVQFAVALMFASAFWHKFIHGHFTLRWALSDNLRHHLLVKYDLADLPRPPLADWLIDHPWRYRTAAMLNLISQAAPFAAVFLMKRPVWRAICGAFFILEILALGLVVDLWNLHWLPLAAVFIDWDRLLTRAAPPAAPPDWKPPRGPRIFIIAFIIYDVITALTPTVDRKLNTYPFSGFPMFATIRARPPYDQHLAYDVPGDSYEVATIDRPMDTPTQQWFDHQNRGMHAVRNPDELQRRLSAVLAQGKKRYWDYGVQSVRLWLTIYEAPPYPQRAHVERHRIAVVGEITPDGTFRTMLGKLAGTTLMIAPRNVTIAEPKLVYYKDDVPTPIPLDAPFTDNRFDLSHARIDGNPQYFVVIVDGTQWLVASRSRWVWN